jgi:hypothetical protein
VQEGGGGSATPGVEELMILCNEVCLGICEMII